MKKIFAVVISFFFLFFLLRYLMLIDVASVRGKFSGSPITQIAFSQEELKAQATALADSRVQNYIQGHRTTVFNNLMVGQQYQSENADCKGKSCLQVNIYDFTAGATVVAIVNTKTGVVQDVLYQPYNRPMVSADLRELATQIILNDPEVIRALGFRPTSVDMAPNDAGLKGSRCDSDHICLAGTFELDDRNLWAVVDLTDQKLAGLFWTNLRPNKSGQIRSVSPVDCPTPGNVNRLGWEVNYEVSPTDGLNVYNVAFNGVSVLHLAKNVEWHVDYGSGGYIDSTGCGGSGGSGGYPVLPYGETEVNELLNPDLNHAGFEIVQDFRMSSWGSNCNYRYEQRFEFYEDGEFRVLSGAYGRGCGVDPVYRPVLYLDLAVTQDENNFYSWDATDWKISTIEAWWQKGPDLNNHQWKITDDLQQGYYIDEVLTGRVPEKNPYLYLTHYKISEGSADLGSFDEKYCCQDSYQQGPQNFLDGDITRSSDLVLWYIPQLTSNSAEGSENCWTVQGEPNPITYPCFGGLKFTPIEPIPTGVQLENSSNSKQIGMGDSLGIFLILVLATFIWLLVRIIFPRS